MSGQRWLGLLLRWIENSSYVTFPSIFKENNFLANWICTACCTTNLRSSISHHQFALNLVLKWIRELKIGPVMAKSGALSGAPLSISPLLHNKREFFHSLSSTSVTVRFTPLLDLSVISLTHNSTTYTTMHSCAWRKIRFYILSPISPPLRYCWHIINTLHAMFHEAGQKDCFPFYRVVEQTYLLYMTYLATAYLLQYYVFSMTPQIPKVQYFCFTFPQSTIYPNSKPISNRIQYSKTKLSYANSWP